MLNIKLMIINLLLYSLLPITVARVYVIDLLLYLYGTLSISHNYVCIWFGMLSYDAKGNQASFVIFPSGAPHTVCTFYAKDKGGFSPHRAHRNDVIERDIIRQLLILIGMRLSSFPRILIHIAKSLMSFVC
jgi:hypothetical protein